MTGALFDAATALAVVLGAIFLLAHAARRWSRRSGPDPWHRIDVLARVGLGPKQGLALVQTRGRSALVSWGEGGVRLLFELDARDALAVAPDRDGGDPAPHGRGRGMRALLLAALAAGALAGAAPAGAAQQDAAAATPPPAAAALQAAQQLAPRVDLQLGGGAAGEGVKVSGPVGAVLLIGAMTLLPTVLLMMTGFTRILIVLHLLKQALGTQTAPPAHLLSAMALLLTGFVMAPTLQEVNRDAITPWMEGRSDEMQMLRAAVVPFRDFMLRTTRREDLEQFVAMSPAPAPASPAEVPTVVVASAFVVSELTSAFQMGFALFLPFLVIDLVVASVLMAMGMFMLPPMMVSLPFKLLLFVMVDGWSLVVESLVRSF